MTINCIKEMNLYFHMQNHYKKLRSAKSQIDISKHPNLPMSKSENQLRVYRVNERHENVCPILPRQYRKKQNSPESKSEPCMSQNYLKKETINHTNSEIPPELQFMNKGGKKCNIKLLKKEKMKQNELKKLGDILGSKSSSLSNNNNIEEPNVSLDDLKESIISSRTNSLTVEDKDCDLNSENISHTTLGARLAYTRAEEHEYLQFLLRVTEDIIINNYSKAEDIEKVFDYHIDVNKERLNMEKMISQITGLALSLNISSNKYQTSHFINEKYIFEPCIGSFDSTVFQNCECSVKRQLIAPKKHQNVPEEIYLNQNDNLDSHKLDISLNVCESTKSVNIIDENLKYPSEVQTPKSHQVEILHVLELKPINDKAISSNKNELDDISSDFSLTAVTGSVSDDVRSQVEASLSLDNLSNDNMDIQPNILFDNRIGHSENSVCSKQGILIENQKMDKNVYFEKEKTLKRDLTFVKSSTVIEARSSEKVKVEINSSRRLLIEPTCPAKPISVETKDKYTQIFIERKDEECGTSHKFDEVDKSGDYVLVNGPLYILKEALSPERRIVLKENEHVDIDIAPVKDISQANQSSNNVLEDNLNLSDYSILTDSSLSFINNINYSRLLHSDYDLTPQKDESAKYHYLMVDAYTSISNANLKSPQDKDDLLITSESYVNPQITENVLNQKSYLNSGHDDTVENSLTNLNDSPEAYRNLIAKSEKYLIEHEDLSMESLGEVRSKMDTLLYKFMETEESENSSIMPIEQPNRAHEIVPAPMNNIDNYKINDTVKISSADHFRFRRYNSFQ